MECKELRDLVEEFWAGDSSPGAREHLARCAACQVYARDVRLVRAGFHALAAEPVPEASPGLAARVIRRLAQTPGQGVVEEFFEQVGRRFVYATLAVTLAFLLALALPSSGPVRGAETTDVLMSQPETANLRPEAILGSDLPDRQEMPLAQPPVNTKGIK
jgi:hypothetical protein